eukprot:scaffold4286_cov92-Amphora_coffeaeformis.AAC.19
MIPRHLINDGNAKLNCPPQREQTTRTPSRQNSSFVTGRHASSVLEWALLSSENAPDNNGNGPYYSKCFVKAMVAAATNHCGRCREDVPRPDPWFGRVCWARAPLTPGALYEIRILAWASEVYVGGSIT